MDDFLNLARDGKEKEPVAEDVEIEGMTLECGSCRELVDKSFYNPEDGILKYTCECGYENKVEGFFLDYE